MALLDLPNTPGCIVCGHQNPYGLHLRLRVDDASGVVHVSFTPAPHHIGFVGVTHGGVLATVLDEAMVWAATWHGKRFCLCGEMSVRYRKVAETGKPVHVDARVVNARARLLETQATVRNDRGEIIATATAKYLPLNDEENRKFVATVVDEPTAREAVAALRQSAGLAPGTNS